MMDKINIVEIKPADYNPRRISEEEYDKLTHSLNEFGLVDPIIINLKNNKIIGGHQRYDVLFDMSIDNEKYQELNLIKLGDIGWAFPDTELTVKSEDHEKALNLALNKISGEWDEVKLKPLLEDLSLKGFDVDLTGFDIGEIEELEIDSPADEDCEVVEDDYVDDAPVELETDIKEGDKFKLGSHYLMCGDSNQRETIDALIDGDTIDLLFTDPPYGINVVNSNNEVGTTFSLGFDGADPSKIVKAKKYKQIINDDKEFDPSTLLSLELPSIIWGANNFSSKLPDSAKWLVWFKKPYGDERKSTFSDVELAWTNIKGKTCTLYHQLWAGLLREGDRETELTERVHPTQKPVKMLSEIIQDYTEENENVLDVFGGSGSTLIACEQTNRNCYMMELDPHYCQVIINRWEEFTGRKAEKIN